VPAARVFATTDAPPGLLPGIRRLLDDAFEGTFTDEDWEHTLGGWHVVVREGERPLAHAAVVPRTLEVAGRRLRGGYVEGVASAPDRQREGLGSLAMLRLMAVLRSRFEVGALSTERHAFYARLGWERWAGPTYVQQGERRLRTAEEDAGIMVLRFGPSRHLALDAEIACRARSGDDW
jgi:aminoglycoside 2'-N-acetyltransferase I